ncbi:hypothetical protein [Paenibacillus aestuarii]|uniref:Uncharacterized protein n=1 Tax=Paenibacillus aestuarii TaxID=516965 RepID=A0ABW0K5H8_9BACL|nr:hypothetical protein [Paenibacillus aestuarii]
MSLAICILLTWVVIIILSLIPKKLSELEMIFLYFCNIIFEISVFTILHLNLQIIQVSNETEKSFADLVLRIIMIPTVMMISSNVLLYAWGYLKWILAAMMILSFIGVQKLIEALGILSTTNWNVGYTVIMFSIYVAFSRLAVWWIQRAGRKDVKWQ